MSDHENLPTADDLRIIVEDLIKKEEHETTTQYYKYVCDALKTKMLHEPDRTQWFVRCVKTNDDCDKYHSYWRWNYNLYSLFGVSIITPYEMSRYMKQNSSINPRRYSETQFVNYLMEGGYNIHTEVIYPKRDLCDIHTWWCTLEPLEIYVISIPPSLQHGK